MKTRTYKTPLLTEGERRCLIDALVLYADMLRGPFASRFLSAGYEEGYSDALVADLLASKIQRQGTTTKPRTTEEPTE